MTHVSSAASILLPILGVGGLVGLGLTFFRAIPMVAWVLFSLAVVLAGYAAATLFFGDPVDSGQLNAALFSVQLDFAGSLHA